MWLAGQTGDENFSVAVCDHGIWKRPDVRNLESLQCRGLVADLQGSLWTAYGDKNGSQVGVAELSPEGAKLHPFTNHPWKGPPDPAVGPDGTFWFRGISVMHRWKIQQGNPLPVTPLPGTASSLLPDPIRTGFIFEGVNGGLDGYGFLETNDTWSFKNISLEDAGVADQILRQRQRPGPRFPLLIQGAILMISSSSNRPPQRIPLPGNAEVAGLVAGPGDDLWVGTSKGAIRRVNQHRQLRTRAFCLEKNIRLGGTLRVSAELRQKGVLSEAGSESQFEWTFDNASMGAASLLPPQGIDISQLSAGEHLLKIVGVDEYGRVAEDPVQIDFRIQNIPLEMRWWFQPAAIGLFVLLATLVLVSIRTNRRLAHQKLQLETLVKARTRELQETTVVAQRLALESTAANRAKTEFLAAISHELRTPMTGFLGLVELLEESHLNPSQRSYLKLLRRCGTESMEVFQRLLDFQRLQDGREDPASESFDLDEVCRQALELAFPTAEAKQLLLEFHGTPGSPTIVLGDPAKVRVILRELIGNGLKFTNHGRVFLEICQPVGDKVKVLIHDTGVGIPEDQRARLYASFSQGDGSQKRPAQGLGLGLSMCRELVHQMRGDLGFESQEGVGSTFWFTLPRAVIASTNPI